MWRMREWSVHDCLERFDYVQLDGPPWQNQTSGRWLLTMVVAKSCRFWRILNLCVDRGRVCDRWIWRSVCCRSWRCVAWGVRTWRRVIRRLQRWVWWGIRGVWRLVSCKLLIEIIYNFISTYEQKWMIIFEVINAWEVFESAIFCWVSDIQLKALGC